MNAKQEWPKLVRDILSALSIAALIWAGSTLNSVMSDMKVITLQIQYTNERIDILSNNVSVNSDRIREIELRRYPPHGE